MKRTKMTRRLLPAVLALFPLALTQSAFAAVSVSRAELSGSALRVEGGGATPNTRVTVNGGQASDTSDRRGNFRIESRGFAAPADCRILVSDGTSSAAATLSGCSASPAPTPAPPSAAPSLAALSVSPLEILQGESATGIVALTATAPPGGFVITLEVMDMAGLAVPVATVPPSVTVPAGQTSAAFTVSTFPDSRGSAAIVGTVDGDWDTEKHTTITVFPAFHHENGSIAILPEGNGSGHVTSSPAGIDCTITRGNGSGTCWTFFPVGTVVRLDARPAADSRFVGWREALPGCFDASRVTTPRGTTIVCSPGFFQ